MAKKRVLTEIHIASVSSGTTPVSGFLALYTKSDNKFYTKTSAGLESSLAREGTDVSFSSIAVTGNVDGVDISAFKTAYDGHTHTESMVIACSNESDTLVASSTNAIMSFRMPYAVSIIELRASLSGGGTGITEVDIKEGGTTIFGTNKLTIDDGERSSTTAATAYDLSDSHWAEDAEMKIYLTSAPTGGKGLKVTLIYTKS